MLPCPCEAGVNQDESLHRGTLHEAATTIAPSPLWIQSLDEREVQRLGAGIALGQHKTTESHQIWFLLLGRLFRGTRTAMLPVISHVTEHQSNGTDGALAPAEADLQTLAGNTITQLPRPSSPMRLQERGERREGRGRRRRGGDEWTLKTSFSFLNLISAFAFRNTDVQPVSNVVSKFNFQLNAWSYRLRTCYLMGLYRFMLRLWF